MLLSKCLRKSLVLGLSALMGLSCFSVLAGQAKDHPAFNRIPGATIKKYDKVDYDEINIVLSVPYEEAEQWKADEIERIGGNYTYIFYKLPTNISQVQAFRNYQKLVKRQGMDILFSCEKPCGGKWASLYDWEPVINDGRENSYSLGEPVYYLAARKGNLTVTFLVSRQNKTTKVFQYVIEEEQVNDSLISPIALSLVESGKIDLYGILFDTGKAEIKPDSAGELADLAQVLSDYPKLEIDIVGHTDNVGAKRDNRKLSAARAEAVMDYLIDEHGISEDRLNTIGRGQTQPVADNGTDKGRALNRRVEISALNAQVIVEAQQQAAPKIAHTKQTDSTNNSKAEQESSGIDLDDIGKAADTAGKIFKLF
ncbi:OmpA family protein [Agarivorans sp. TSD2052]|uniref:OmpA family protein n=1 Tax=Agarivorans sp. TSD2052 TaxID=2937286 RepID=UPI00200CC7F7|nr:OmpA family protein [Agarivorans sp. TSD2052]UPW19948.1 OmpA family protein [Agarivorans sp. TSD2052]